MMTPENQEVMNSTAGNMVGFFPLQCKDTMFPMKKSSQAERECLKISVFKNYFGECKKTSLFFYISMGWERVDTRKETSGMSV